MKEQLLAALTPYDQQHLLAFWDALDDSQRQTLAAQIREIDFESVARLYERKDNQSDFRALAERAEPPPAFRLDAAGNRFKPRQAQERGRHALAAGEVGAILVAGGQGTRLGFPHPKGMYPIGPVSGKSLFQIHVEKILAAARRYGARIPLYMMTSPATHDETVEYFARHGRFGLPEEDLVIFCQGTMPAVDLSGGKILLERPGRIAVSPDGHGGMLAAIARGGTLRAMRRRGIRHLFYFQVDNPLADICSSEFLGYHLLDGSEMTTQVIAKQDPFERVGNVVRADGRLMVIEYSDLPDVVAQRRNPDGSLAIWAGSIAVHAIDAAFLERTSAMADALPFHIARKKVACVDAAGRTVEPKEPNAIKFERFIFDLIPLASHATVVEIDPAEGFAPLKNGPGAPRDTAEWVQAQMTAQHRRWLRRAGVEVADGLPVEIGPLWALDAEEVAEKVKPGERVTEARYWGD
jgi:UDP-N-acetylglucosamine/UDP-N-acetylgalactosamine diphosphorylase